VANGAIEGKLTQERAPRRRPPACFGQRDGDRDRQAQCLNNPYAVAMSSTTRKPTPPATTAIYCRISEDSEGDRKGVDRQLKDCTALVKREGWKLVAEPYIDNDISAFSGKVRPAYTEMLAKVRAGEIGRVVVWHMDRLHRQTRELLDLIDLAEAGKLEIVTATGPSLDLNTSDGQMTATILVSVARKSSQDTARRQRSKQQELREAGYYTGGPRPFGWQANGEKGMLVPHPREAAILLKAMDDVLAGRSLNDIGREWTDAKVRDRDWGGNDVARVLTMPRHAGLVVHHGLVGDAPGKWKPLVTRERWEQVCAAVNDRSRFAGLPRRRSLLTGILRCGACDAPMARSIGVKGVRLWRCHAGPRRDGCGGVSVRASLVEPIVVEAAMQYVDRLDLAKLLNKSKSPDSANTARELAALDKRETAMGAAAAAGKVNMRTVESFTKTIEAQRAALRTKLAREVKSDALAPFAGRVGALRAAWSTLSTDQQRSIIAESLKVITVMPVLHRGQRFESKRIVLGQPRKK